MYACMPRVVEECGETRGSTPQYHNCCTHARHASPGFAPFIHRPLDAKHRSASVPPGFPPALQSALVALGRTSAHESALLSTPAYSLLC
jgi:hypothetical protein